MPKFTAVNMQARSGDCPRASRFTTVNPRHRPRGAGLKYGDSAGFWIVLDYFVCLRNLGPGHGVIGSTMKTRVFAFGIAGLLLSGPAFADSHQRLIAAEHARCISANAERYLERSPIIIIVNRCPEPGLASDVVANQGTSQLPDIENMTPEQPARPNVLYFSRSNFRCLVAYWRNQPNEIMDFVIPEAPCG